MVGMLHPRGTSMPRMWLVDCPVCHRWSTVPTLHVQAICREAACCLDCMKNEYFVLKVRIVAIEEAMALLVNRGKKLPEDQRGPLREVYARKTRQLKAAREQLTKLEAGRAQHRELARALA